MGLKLSGIYFKPKTPTRRRSYALTQEVIDLIQTNTELLEQINGHNVTQNEAMLFMMQVVNVELQKILTKKGTKMLAQTGT